MQKISFVFPVYNEEGNIEQLFSEIIKLKNQLTFEMEVIFINDGSTDRSYQMLQEICQQNNFVKLLNFSRNFGHQAAITAGLDHTTGDAVIIMDSDLQDPPEVALELIKKWQEGYDVVYAKRRTRQDRWFKKITAHYFYRILNYISEIKIPQDVGDFRLMNKKVVEELKKFKETNRFIRGLTSYIGFKQTFVFFDRKERKVGVTHYSLHKMIKFAVDGITGFSVFPLRFITYFGLLVCSLSFLGFIYALYTKFYSFDTSNLLFILTSIFFMGGVQMLMIGILGTYIARIYKEGQKRPLYIIQKKINFSENIEPKENNTERLNYHFDKK